MPPETSSTSAEAADGSSESDGAGVAPAQYLAEVMADIDAEVRRRRAAGDIPPGLERELDELFLEFSPVGMSGSARMRETLALVDGAAFIDTAVPIASEKMVGSQVKRLIRSSVSWYMGFIVHQVVKFAWATSRMFHVVVDHVEELEAAVESQRVPDLPDAVAPAVELDDGWWTAGAVTALKGVKGRVLHADCGDGTLLDRLLAAGVDAYGVDPAEQLVEVAADRGLDVRAERPLDHLEVVGREELSGVVLSGSVQWLSPRGREQLVELLATRLAPGGVVVLHSATPEHWQTAASPLVRDLAPGRPLHPETWAHLLGARGFDPPVVTTGGGDDRLEPVADGAPDADRVNRAIDVVNRLLLGPAEYLLVAAR
ncbi:MAG: class I SAM-dependent methyltransferase, partial [Acidimicrobiales bacterium]|nr:class I SAM-dependent methyltransferase [Acidimicrobiales bacterium]